MHWSQQFWGSTSYLNTWPLGTGEMLIQTRWITPKGTHNTVTAACTEHNVQSKGNCQHCLCSCFDFAVYYCIWLLSFTQFDDNIWYGTEANRAKLFVEGGLFSVNEISFTFVSFVSLFTCLFTVVVVVVLCVGFLLLFFVCLFLFVCLVGFLLFLVLVLFCFVVFVFVFVFVFCLFFVFLLYV